MQLFFYFQQEFCLSAKALFLNRLFCKDLIRLLANPDVVS